ncbi:hypothetical protein GUJ93_ZPchr0011g27242 [Zizania palustris]|uniref:Uncharacterized protein n=1 Tax=Zizania palustris TaxID=103762 RepID=A0A8J5WIE7_ZIZPA|nr:hypothetical protein GUJ93_ZPchr0011g27242 [Zizania palustris]
MRGSERVRASSSTFKIPRAHEATWPDEKQPKDRAAPAARLPACLFAVAAFWSRRRRAQDEKESLKFWSRNN